MKVAAAAAPEEEKQAGLCLILNTLRFTLFWFILYRHGNIGFGSTIEQFEVETIFSSLSHVSTCT
jgi:hypothetical protein